MTQKLAKMKEELDNIRNFNIPLSRVDRTTIVDFKNTINQLVLTNIYKTLHPKTVEYTFLLKCIWNILQGKPYTIAQNKSQ